MRKRSGRSTLEKVVTVNAGVILLGAVLGTLLVRRLPHVSMGVIVVVYFVVMLVVMAAANYLVLRRAFRPLLELSHAMASISRPATDQPIPVEAMPDPDFGSVVESFSAMLDRMALESRSYAAKVFESIEDERRRIGRELHDETSQSLVAALLNLDMAEESMDPGSKIGTHRSSRPARSCTTASGSCAFWCTICALRCSTTSVLPRRSSGTSTRTCRHGD